MAVLATLFGLATSLGLGACSNVIIRHVFGTDGGIMQLQVCNCCGLFLATCRLCVASTAA
ncbi:hypothetical protein OK016_01640 [Vibrio chagasii]|nr:hypothetical protein [Vibrio chagasii]